MATNPDSIGNFLESLSPRLEQLGQPPQSRAGDNLEIRVMFAMSNGLYPVVVHLIVLGRGVTANDLEGRLLKGQWTFQAKSLKEFCDFYEFAIFDDFGGKYHPEEGIRYHRDPQQSMPILPHQNVVNYRLVTKLDDPQGDQLLELVWNATHALFLNYTPPS